MLTALPIEANFVSIGRYQLSKAFLTQKPPVLREVSLKIVYKIAKISPFANLYLSL
jgi:hypothetical protein